MQVLTFRPSAGPITVPVTKFGGQPVWVDKPAWPLSRTTGRPMRFICQVGPPADMQAGGRVMAYVFMTDEDEYVEGTYEAEAGENAVILQPGPFAAVVQTQPLRTGPTLQQWIDDMISRVRRPQDVELAVDFVETAPDDPAADRNWSQFLGEPRWLQGDDWPPGGPWRFLLQIDSQGGGHYDVNFGDAGVAYVFVAADGGAARFFWQCC